MTREPEWDARTREWAIEDSYYRSAQCPHCGTHHDLSHDETVGRNVERIERDTCLDCKAIEGVREQYHRERRHTDESCDCDDFVFYVDRYLPIPPGGA